MRPPETKIGSGSRMMSKICVWQHVYYHLSLSESDRLMLLVHTLPELILFFSGQWWPQSRMPDIPVQTTLWKQTQNFPPRLLLQTRNQKRSPKESTRNSRLLRRYLPRPTNLLFSGQAIAKILPPPRARGKGKRGKERGGEG